MAKIYRRNCDYCGSYYEGRGQYYCSVSCRLMAQIDKSQSKNIDNPKIEFWEYLDKNEKENVSWREFFDIARKHQSLNKRLSTSQDKAVVQVETKKPYFAIVFTADWHGGSISTDYKAMEHYFDLILRNDLHIITLGDLNDNFRKFRSLEAIFSQVLSPKQQMEMLRSLVEEFAEKRKWIAACWGNHDVSWDEKNFGQSPVKQLLGKHFVYFNGKGLLELRINDQIYKIAMSHVFPGRSIYNPTHSLIRALKQDFGASNPDVIVQGDKHNYSYQWFTNFSPDWEGHPCHFIQVGTFKVDDGYSKRFWSKGQIGLPVILFDANSHESHWFQTPEMALKFLK